MIIADPRIDFSNTLTKADIEGMAEMDEMEVVREVQVSPSPFGTAIQLKEVGMLCRLFGSIF